MEVEVGQVVEVEVEEVVEVEVEEVVCDIGAKLACTTASMIAFAFIRASSLPVSSTCKDQSRQQSSKPHRRNHGNHQTFKFQQQL